MRFMNKTKNIRYVSFLSIVAALGGFLFGYDTAVISGTVSQVSAQFQLSAMQSGWYVGCALVGSIAGVIFAGVLSDKLVMTNPIAVVNQHLPVPNFGHK